ncbi:MAG: SDR family oxidoreductase [Spirochaetales bacterium]|nr:SDR family oxidoreductase [Spirochaetales bacterium]
MKVKSFENKCVYIFGASEGIGFALAEEFLLLGAHVVIFSRSAKKLDTAKKMLFKETKCSTQDLQAISLDVTSFSQVKKILFSTVKNEGIPDIIINNVGRAIPAYFEKISEKQFRETIEINVMTSYHTLSVLLPLMKKKGGYVVNVSSMLGFMGMIGYADYAAAKFGIIGLTEALRNEYRSQNIGFSVLCPPDTLTPGFERENKTKPYETEAVSESIKPVTAQAVARSCLQGIKKGKFLINTSFLAKLTWFIKQHFPGLIFSIIDGDVKKALQKRQRSNDGRKGAHSTTGKNKKGS